MVRSGTVVAVGVSLRHGKIVGDADPEVAEVARAWPLVLRGLGPVTTALSLSTVVEAARRIYQGGNEK